MQEAAKTDRHSGEDRSCGGTWPFDLIPQDSTLESIGNMEIARERFLLKMSRYVAF